MHADLIILCVTVLLLGAGALGAYLYVHRKALAGEALLRELGTTLEAALARTAEREPGPSRVGRTVVVHTRRPDDQSIRGVLVADHADRITLAEAVYYREGGGKQTAGGDLDVRWANVSTMQVITPTEE